VAFHLRHRVSRDLDSFGSIHDVDLASLQRSLMQHLPDLEVLAISDATLQVTSKFAIRESCKSLSLCSIWMLFRCGRMRGSNSAITTRRNITQTPRANRSRSARSCNARPTRRRGP